MAWRACAACKMQRKKCTQKCVFAPHFPSTDPHKFAVVHSVFGTIYVLKMIQSVPDELRADVVNSLVFEASARVSDPVHGCKRTIDQLQNQIAELESHLASIQAELERMRGINDQLVSLLNMGEQDLHPVSSISQQQIVYSTTEDDDHLQFWDPLWKL